LYFQPYGNGQQINLNWIINEIIELHKQLDPDYETPKFSQIYPYSNLEQLNLDWILSELKTLKELAPEPVPQELDIQAVAEALVALPFDSSKSYQLYDFISRDGEIYRATEAIAAGGVWDETKWFKTKLGTDLAVLERWINAINTDLTTLQNTVEDLSSADISDDSDAGGATVKASLNALKGSLNSLNKIENTEVINFDTVTKRLVYFDYANSTGTKPPISYNGYLITIIRDEDQTITQFAWDNGNYAPIYKRQKVGGVWNSWGKEYRNTNLLTWGNYKTVGQKFTLPASFKSFDAIQIIVGAATNTASGGGVTYTTFHTAIMDVNDLLNSIYYLNGSLYSVSVTINSNTEFEIYAIRDILNPSADVPFGIRSIRGINY